MIDFAYSLGTISSSSSLKLNQLMLIHCKREILRQSISWLKRMNQPLFQHDFRPNSSTFHDMPCKFDLWRQGRIMQILILQTPKPIIKNCEAQGFGFIPWPGIFT